MEKGVRAPADPEAGQIRLKVLRELPPLPGGADVRPGQWDSHAKGPLDWRLLVLSQVQDVASHSSNNPT